jgi:WD40 repeat protein
MEFEDIAQLVNQAAIAQKGRPLKDVERLVLEGAWHHQTYGAMADTAGGYTEDYLKKDVGPKLWHLLSDLMGQGQVRVTKRNIRNVLQHWAQQQAGSPGQISTVDSNSPGAMASSTVNPGDAESGLEDLASPFMQVSSFPRLDVADFVGRRQELMQLQQWLRAQDCRAIALWGLAGVGKTALITKLLTTWEAPPGPIGYLSLQPGVTNETFLQALVVWLRQLNPETAEPQGGALSWVLQRFEERRYVLILDQSEALFQPKHLAGTFRTETHLIQQFFQRVVEQVHQSVVVWVSREKPLELSHLRGGQIRDFHLTDLSLAALPDLLGDRLLAHDQDWQLLFEQYGGNPLLLKGIAAAVEDVYQGRLKAFLSSPDSLVPQVFRANIVEVLHRLTDDELVILCWLALAHEPVPLSRLRQGMVPPPPAMVIQSLLSRSLCHSLGIEAGATVDLEAIELDLSPVMRSITLDRLRSDLMQELLDNRLTLFHRLPLVFMTSQEAVQEQQRQALLVPLGEALQRHYPETEHLTTQCQHLHRSLRHLGANSPGYGAGNFIHLCTQMGVSVSGVNFAHLSIWQGDLRYVNLQGADFSHARFANTVFATALGRNPVMALSQDGQYLAIGDQEGRLLVWQPHSGRLMQVLQDGLMPQVRALAFSPAVDLLALGTETGSIGLWSLSGRYQRDTLLEQGPPILSLDISPDGRCLVAANAHGQVTLWDLASGEMRGEWHRHRGAIHQVTFGPQGQTLLSSGDDQRAWLWSLTEATDAVEFQAGPMVQLRTAGFIADPQWPDRPPQPVVAGYDEQTLTLWHVETGRSLWAVPIHGQSILAMALDPHGQHLTCSYQDFSVALWNLPRSQLCYRLPPFDTPVWALVFSPAGQWFATGGDYTVKLWDTARGTCLRSFLSQAHPVRCLAFTGPGQQLLTGHDDHTLRLWPLNKPGAFTSCPGQLTGHRAFIRAVATSADGRWLASSADDATIRLWRATTCTCERVLTPLSASASVLAFSPDGQWLASAGDDCPIMVWNTATGSTRYLAPGQSESASALGFSGDGRWLISGGRDGRLQGWNLLEEGTYQTLTGHQGRVHSLAVNQTGSYMVSASHDGTVRWWNLIESEQLGSWQHPEGQWLQTVILGSQDTVLAVTSQAYIVEVWDVQAQYRLHRLEGHSQPIWQVVASPDHALLATASQDDEIRIWQLGTAGCLQVLRPDRPYEGANILGAEGLTPPETTMLKALGAVTRYANQTSR